MARELRLRRIYEPPSPDDGFRVLVDRLWPRGVRKADAHVDLWLKAVAPSPSLRRWFHAGQDERWAEFRARYLEELQANPAVADLREITAKGPVTLLYAAKDPGRNHAVVLADYLKRSAAET